MAYSIQYPRKSVARHTLRLIARSIFPILTKSTLLNLQNLPTKGPVILVGNHTGTMEVVMMATFARRPVEFMGASDLPWDGFLGSIIDLYGLIPIFRGETSHKSMKMGVDVLRQGGFLGLFPEGGYWEPGKQQAQTGVAWISHLAQAPILPIGFGDTGGKLDALLRLKRPELVMNVGELMPPVQLPKGKKKKDALQKAADEIMAEVWRLVPESAKPKVAQVENERFELQIEVRDTDNQRVEIPREFPLNDTPWLSRFIHRLNLINTMRDDVRLPVIPLKTLPQAPALKDIITACDSVTNYVETQNTPYFTYRYGQADGTAMHNSFYQFRNVVQWALDNNYTLTATPLHKYTDSITKEECVKVTPEEISLW